MTKNNLYSHLKKSVLQFCTISTASHLFKAYALADSLAPYGVQLHILVVDDFERHSTPKNTHHICLKDKLNLPNYSAVFNKYQTKKDKLRWALKPVFLLDLLETNERVVYVDNDCFFFGSPLFIDELLKESNVLLTPHFYKSNPQNEQNWLEANYRVGLYNAGFVAVNQKASAALNWWMQCCLYSLKKAYWRGLFDDQKYLDLLPIQFEGVKVLKHRGCNLAGWNDDSVEITSTKTGWRINQHDELVFVHFAALTIKKWMVSSSFKPLLDYYTQALQQHNPSYTPKVKQARYQLSAYFYYLRWKLVRFFE